ncbi:AAA family ATPase [Flammeovirga sp. SJP92]|uniref:AAA family ATPase n=1 Tax=Flammeovirga sp. SJP92 TaxID=1775430 RepID=UPI0007891C68|nr:AAA family ATPase [Flammeovirga sp. SJP92]KXX70468.1 ATPase [Flammeovirga sp. SJP92]
MSKQSNHNYTFYGTQTKAQEVYSFVHHLLESNKSAEEKGKKQTPICIWGRHGIGKTEIVEQIAKENGYKWSYIAPAQFEEMGDLVGMPTVENGVTTFKSPEWVPTEEGPGILLIDDVNRADDRILRGIMQLLQNYELVSWKLPKGWQIVLTANPDGGDYSVTPMDDAMLTRMMHVTMKFDYKDWALWAEKNGVDERGINFVLTYPEIVSGDRTTPRTLVQFFDAISSIKDLTENLGLVQMLADSCLDETAGNSFIAFVNQNLEKLISSEDILNAKKFKEGVETKIADVVLKETLRVDIIATICTRMVNYLEINTKKLTKTQLDNLKQFIKLEFLPNDIRLTMLQDLMTSKNTSVKMVMADVEIGKMLLQKM